MNRWLPLIEALGLDSRPCCLFTSSGELVWRSPYWTNGQYCTADDAQVLGHRYLKNVAYEHRDALLTFFEQPAPRDFTFRAQYHVTGEKRVIAYSKLAVPGGLWLVMVAIAPAE